jgi:hypothetical protein
MSWWWLSFVDPDRPKGERFLGVCVVEAPDLRSAIRAAWKAKCNPGGEVGSWEIEPSEQTPEQRALLERTPKYTLMSREDLCAAGHDGYATMQEV